MSESRKHHFVPRFILAPWAVDLRGQNNVAGYWWDARQEKLRVKNRGVGSFCFQIDLLTLQSPSAERDALERVFFGNIDTRGAAARDALLERGPSLLEAEERRHFAGLLLSLEARRPANVKKLRADGGTFLAQALNKDPEIAAKLSEFQIDEEPAKYAERVLGVTLEDRALQQIDGLVDNPKVGERLINAHWIVRTVSDQSQTFILSDRPLVRVYGYDHPDAVWALPLAPRVVFFAANSASAADTLHSISDERLVKNTNMSSASQAERFAFSVDDFHARWLGRYLKG